MRYKPLFVLDIPDDYMFMDPALVDLLETAMGPIIQQALDKSTF